MTRALLILFLISSFYIPVVHAKNKSEYHRQACDRNWDDENFDNAFTNCYPLAKNGLPEYERRIAWMYTTGKGVQQDFNQAEYFLSSALNKGYTPAIAGFASIAMEKDDYEAAVSILKTGSIKGDSRCQRLLGLILTSGEGGIIKNTKEGIYWLNEAAKQNDRIALSQLGALYLNGDEVPRDLEKGRQLTLRAAKLGDEQALNNLKIEGYNAAVREHNAQVNSQWLWGGNSQKRENPCEYVSVADFCR